MAIKHRNLTVEEECLEVPGSDSGFEILHNYYWSSHKEPHGLRRQEMIKKYPEIQKLMGHEPLTKWIVMAVISMQLLLAYYLRNTHPISWKFFFFAYVFGATATQNIFLAIHELSHNLGFKKPIHNKLFAIFTNTPIGIPYSASFSPYHQLHHKFLGDEIYDTDIPTRFEAVLLSNILGKAFFATFQIFFYALRPMFVTSIKFTYIHLLNVLYQFVFDYIWIKNFGWYSFCYFIMSAFLAGSLHPCSGHFIAEHYLLNLEEAIVGGKLMLKLTPAAEKPVKITDEANVSRPDVDFKEGYALETFSYYGILNVLTWNVGLHNEHHDFPFVAWSKLWKLNEMCPEYYQDLPKHSSWCKVLFEFITHDDVVLYNRVKRVNKEFEKKKP